MHNLGALSLFSELYYGVGTNTFLRKLEAQTFDYTELINGVRI